MNYNKKRILPVLVAILAVLLALAVLSSGVAASILPPLEVNKTAYDPDSGEWVKELPAKINDTVQFKCIIHNSGYVNLTQIRFWDIMDCSLNYSLYSLKINGEDQILPDCWVNRFKPKVLHPYYGAWNLSDPLGVNFTELCPQDYVLRQIVGWNDTYLDGNVSACDQVKLTGLYGSEFWYHVDRVPYTLYLSDDGFKYFDSVLDWNDPGMNLSDPNGTEWLEVCCCKDKYVLLNWSDDTCSGDDKLGAADTLVLKNLRTGEEEEYTVYDDVVFDLVVSREYEIGTYRSDLIQLEPNQTITIEYNATVVRCGVDNNTFRAKGWFACAEWIYSNEDKATITVPCPSGDAADGTPAVKDVFTVGEPIYALARNFAPNKSVNIYITPVRTWANGDIIADYKIVGPMPAQADAEGNIGINPRVLMWPDPVPGEYHMVFDDPDGDFDVGDDLADWFSVTGGAAAPVITPLGIVALIGLLSIVATSTLLKKRKKR